MDFNQDVYLHVVGWLILYHEVKETNTGVNYKVNDHDQSEE